MDCRKTYYVFFRDGENWFQRWFLKKDFGHIFIMTKTEDKWVVIDPLPDFLHISLFEGIDNIPKKVAENSNSVCLRVFSEQDFSERQQFRINTAIVPRFVSCVGIAKYILGIKCRALTPYGFYKRLLKEEIGYEFWRR